MSASNSLESSPSSSISLVKLDELSSFGATKQSRLPALIKLNTLDQNKADQQRQQVNSMPNFSASQLETTGGEQQDKHQRSLPAELTASAIKMTLEEKENVATVATSEAQQQVDESGHDFQVVDMQQEGEEEQEEQSADVLIGPSLPHMAHGKAARSAGQLDKSINALQSSLQLGQSSQLGDSLIEMIINLRTENQNLIRALETNNDYVKERLSEFKRAQEDAKKREAQFTMEKAEFEHQVRKLQRQNSVLSERLKSMEAKLKDMKLEVSESLQAAHSSRASSIRADQGPGQGQLYPLIDGSESFGNEALAGQPAMDDTMNGTGADGDPHEAATMQVDAASGELLNAGHTSVQSGARFSGMSKQQLDEHFEPNKRKDFYSIDDPLKQCDQLEQQLNDIGKRDYEICLLQQQLNIYRQDFRLERMEKLEAKIQIEKLKNDIDRLCLERLQSSGAESGNEQAPHQDARRASDGLGRLGHRLTKKAARQAAKAAKYAAKQAHLEEKASAALARVAAVRASAAGQTQAAADQAASTTQPKTVPPTTDHGRHHHHHHHHHQRHHSTGGRSRSGGIRSEVVSDLLSTANKAMLTGYKMASTHVNLALDKLSQYEQQQASQLEKNKQQQAGSAPGHTANIAPSAPVQPPSID